MGGLVAAALEEAGVAVEAAEGEEAVLAAAAARAAEVDARLVGAAARLVGRPARGTRHAQPPPLLAGEGGEIPGAGGGHFGHNPQVVR